MITPMCSEALIHVRPGLRKRNWCGFAVTSFRSGCSWRSFAWECQLSPHKSCFAYLVILWLHSCSSSCCHLILRSACPSSSFEWNHTHRAINLNCPSRVCSTVSSAAFIQTLQSIINHISLNISATNLYKSTWLQYCTAIKSFAALHSTNQLSPAGCSVSPHHLVGPGWWRDHAIQLCVAANFSPEETLLVKFRTLISRKWGPFW